MLNPSFGYSDVLVPGNLPQGSQDAAVIKVLRQAEDGDFVFVRLPFHGQN